MRYARSLGVGALVAAAWACSETKSPSAVPAVNAQNSADASACPAQKLAFAQEHACDNDGSVEFCIESADTATQNAVRGIAPDVRFQPGSRGRARCSASQTLTLIPLSERDCPSRHGAATKEAWSRLCALAALDNVGPLVPTWYE